MFINLIASAQVMSFRDGVAPLFLDVNGDTLALATAGGLNAPQLHPLDVNNDGIDDLLMYDRADNNIVVLVSDGKGNYSHAPEYEELFPEIDGWIVTKDYNNDGKKDLWLRSNRTQASALYRNVTQSWDKHLQLELVSESLSAYNFNTDTFWWEDTFFILNHVELYCSKSSIPAIEDVDGDGDVDFLTLQESGQGVSLFLNVCKETKQSLDSPIFEEADLCWGDFVESVDTANSITLQRYKWCSRKYYRYLKKKHSGGSVLLLYDADNDQDMDLILGNSGFENILFLENGKKDLDARLDTIISWTADYPSATNPGEVNIFPGVFMMDVTGDGVKDLMIAPNTTDKLSYLWIDEFNNVKLYENTGSNALPTFEYSKNNAFVGEMVDHGSVNTPILWDYDDDKDLDLILSSTGGHHVTRDLADRLFLYENTGTSAKPVFKLVDQDFLGLASKGFRWIVPTIVDINENGTPELIFGDYKGDLHLYQLIKNGGVWETSLLSDKAFGINSGGVVSPYFTDVDVDGKIDMLLGTLSGKTRYYRNISTTNVPDFELAVDTFGGVMSSGYAWVTFELPNGEFIDTFMQVGDGLAHPSLQDLDGDGKREFIVGGAHGNVYIFTDVEDNYTGKFKKSPIGFYNELTQSYSSLPDFGSYARPVFGDLNGDTIPDILIGNNRGGVMFRQGSMKVSTRNYLKVSSTQVTVYPNPSDGVFNVRSEKEKVRMVEVMDVRGVLLNTVEEGASSVDLTGYRQGIYFLRIYLDNSTVTARIVKN